MCELCCFGLSTTGILTNPTIGGYAVTVVRIVVVHFARGVDNARVVRVGRVRRTQPSVTRRTANIATAL